MLLAKLSHEENMILQKAISLAKQLGVNIYLVGGSFRDILLKNKAFDLDLVVEGNALDFARILNSVLFGVIKVHENFLSANISFANLSLDVHTARKEIYQYYGALPKIEQGSILDDLYRRDFTVNAMALDLRNNIIMDPFGGQRDLNNRLLRTLHKDSFKEDPTRIIRAAKYAARLGFQLEAITKNQLLKAVSYLDCVSASRLKNEYIKIINEKVYYRILQVLNDWRVLPYFLPGICGEGLNIKDKKFINVKSCNNETISFWLINLMVLYWQGAINITDIHKVRFNFTNKELFCIAWLVENHYFLKQLQKSDFKASLLELHQLLCNTPIETEFFLLWLLREKSNIYLQDIKNARQKIKLPLNGRDLLELGIEPGPVMGKVFTDLKIQVLEGEIKSKDDALTWLQRMMNNYVDQLDP